MPDEQRDQRRTVHIPAAQWQALRVQAAETGVSVSARIRQALDQLDTDRTSRAEAEHTKVSEVSLSPELAEAVAWCRDVAANAQEANKPVPRGIAALLASPEYQEWASQGG